MTYLWGRDGLSWMFYVPLLYLRHPHRRQHRLCISAVRSHPTDAHQAQLKLNSTSYTDNEHGTLRPADHQSAFGAILFVVIKIASNIFKLTGSIWNILAYAAPGRLRCRGNHLLRHQEGENKGCSPLLIFAKESGNTAP